MPWHIEESHDSCPADEPWAVVKDADGEVEGCHPSKAEAQDQMAALYANERMNEYRPRDDVFRMIDLSTAQVEFRADTDGPTLGTLHGYMAVFNEWTEIDSWEGRFKEQIAPGAFKRTLKEGGDRVKILFNHGFDPSIGDKPLGKPRVLKEDQIGLYTEVPLDDTSYNRDLVASLRSGALDGMSFRFSVSRETWDHEDEDMPERTIREVARLWEGGPVTFPAYEATTAGVRGREAYEAWRSTHPDPKPSILIIEDDSNIAAGILDESDDTSPRAPVGANRWRDYADNVMSRAEEAQRRLAKEPAYGRRREAGT